jgi:signal transduction histidine kinase/ligand-binding sensor domain-containing protein
MLRKWWLVLALLCLSAAPARALDPSKRISQYAHAAWRIQDGFFKGTPFDIVQTRDGYLWVGTSSGLLRFDGVRFVPWRPEHGAQLPSSDINVLLAGRDGSLWIGTREGLSRWKDDTLTNYPGTAGIVLSILEAHNGDIWFGQSNDTGPGPLCRVVGAGVKCLSDADGVPGFRMPFALTDDASGNIWIGGDKLLVRWSPPSRQVFRPEGLAANFAMGVTAMVPAADGKMWVGIDRPGPGLGLQQIVNGRWSPVKAGDFDGSTLSVVALHVDRGGNVWIGTLDRGLFRLRDNVVDHYDRTNGLSSDSVIRVREDREGNLWVTTNHGLDRFSDTAVVTFSATEGLCSGEAVSILAAGDGGVWAGGEGAVTHFGREGVSCLRTGHGLPGLQVTSLLEDATRRLWVGIDNELWTYEHGRFRRIARPDGRPMGFVTSMALDSGGDVWVVANRPPRTLIRIHDLAVQEEVPDAGKPRRVAADSTGGVWLGLLNGDLAHYRDGKLQTYPFAHSDSALMEQLLPGPVGGSIFAATSYGVIGWQNGRPVTLTEANGLPCRSVHGIVFDDSGGLWLSMECGFGRLSLAELRKWQADSRAKITVELLDELDGAKPGAASFSTATRSLDGLLWFANGFTVQRLDPRRLGRNQVSPPVHIEQLIADRKTYAAVSGLRLPPRPRDLEIDYVGLSFVAPQKVLFRYRLEGRDDAWQEPGTRRQAFYSDLRPGSYRFRVIASNNDGLWNEEGATLDFVVPPAWYQTYSFLALCTVVAAMSLWAVYRFRLRQVSRALNARFDERLAERTRVARDIHDTLLQTVQGSKLAVDDALDHFDDRAETRRTIEQVSQWLGQATREGRATVNSLRASTVEQNDLADALRRAMDDCQRQGSLDPSLTVTGDPREMHPVVRDEVYRMGYEAIRNACTHSHGTRLEVGLHYAHDLTLRVADNGVGIDPAVAGSGKDGHFGLQGMRERATRIGATLKVASSADAGTEIVVLVPGRAIFRKPTRSLVDKFLARFE